ncbi:uncharacterized protein EV420DRAFT_147268 [Desarmillaria tabescens]|uniref:Uncharacterized protein n=1 Tax=Armillaria tabescens TaxID=1929756 RepID=A0AA39NAL7_ARMTA|nr:uncharacterized protein EV420DRAFT_147268 [Desarmillaria tabescens]KAK0462084.1 hypothetical protein EV420DRAFT_147268 [Desarmillaria tabescens]
MAPVIVIIHYIFLTELNTAIVSPFFSGSASSVSQTPTVMPQDSDMRAAVKGFSTQLRTRILQAWVMKPTPNDEYAYCQTRGRLTPCSRCLSMDSVCVAYNIGCSNCSFNQVICSRFLDEKYHRIQRFIAMDVASIPALVQACLDLQRQSLVPVTMRKTFQFSEYPNALPRHSFSRAETCLPVSQPSFKETFPSHLFPGVDGARTGMETDVNRVIHSLRQHNEYLHRENERLHERFRLEVERKGLKPVQPNDFKLSHRSSDGGDEFDESKHLFSCLV